MSGETESPVQNSNSNMSDHVNINGQTENIPLLATAHANYRRTSLPLISDNNGDQRAKSFSEIPLLSGNLTSNGYYSQFQRKLSLLDDDRSGSEFVSRIDSLKIKRPFRLIGTANRLLNWDKFKISDTRMAKSTTGVRNFYEFQNTLIDRYHEVDLLLDTGIHIEMIQNYQDNTSSDASEDENPQDDSVRLQEESKNNLYFASTKMKKHRSIEATPGNIHTESAKIMGMEHHDSGAIRRSINVNFAINFTLLLGKFIVVYYTKSFSLMASLVDSCLDFLSTLIIFFATKYSAKKSSKFPVGRKQLEPIGVLLFSIVIIISFLQVLIDSIKSLFNGNRQVAHLKLLSVIIMLVTIFTKSFIWALYRNNSNSSIRALTEDAKTDVVFNTFSLIFPVLGSIFTLWWVDALGASVLCIYVIIQWSVITFEHVDHLSGSRAPKEYYQQVLYMAFRFSQHIESIKNYKMYYIGDFVNVELDIVVKNKSLSFRDYHDLGESLQYAIETLPYVSRCYVHLDYKVRNYVGHIN
ncbi:hypothetical protein DAMA08_005860 [Martiniozyma asiatica (nom. inval.)]|nr:hypothetical protein DAMA08_005860 [Martiniozyma asiatica]